MVTVITFVSPATQAIGTVSLSQSTLQSAELNATSRKGVFLIVFHHDGPLSRSKRTMYDPDAGAVKPRFTIVLAPGPSGVVICACGPCGCTTTPFDRMRYDTAVPAGIAVCPWFV